MLGDQGRVISFEPEKNNIKALRTNINLNKLKNIEIVELACSDKKGHFDFYLNKENTGGHSLLALKNSREKVIIETDTLDSILKKNNISRADLMKIDVEGAEAEVLKGATKTLKNSHPKIIFEAWDEQYLKKVKKILNKFNYKIKKIAPENYLAY